MTLEPEDQLDLLRRFEPELRFTAGELFFPMSVEGYLRGASLVAGSGSSAVEIAAPGTLTPDLLAKLAREHTGQPQSLSGVEHSLDRAAYRSWRKNERPSFRSSSRFAAVGLPARLVDLLLRLTLLMRGRVPGGFAAAAHQAYLAGAGPEPAGVYYGRVVEDAGYLVLQYWYFYAMNDWRSTFGGVNDHEGDWEQVSIFLVTPDGTQEDLRPVWVAFSSHDEVGDDLRRRWDDSDLTLAGEHPVVFVGAGSHSGAYLEGEYLVGAALPVSAWVRRLAAFFSDQDGQRSSGLNIPFLDYKRGDGFAFGAGTSRPWDPVLIDDRTPWVRDFTGLWGLDTSDPFGGERAPAGPRYERSAVVRRSWSQPVAWVGLDKVAPTRALALRKMARSRDTIADELTAVEAQLETSREELRGAVSAVLALGLPPDRPGSATADLAESVAALRVEQAKLQGLLEGLERALTRPAVDEPVHAHLRHRAVPVAADVVASGRLLRVWAAASASILLAALGVLLLRGDAPLAAILWVAGAMLVVEAVLRRRVVSLLVGAAAIGLAVVGFWAVLSLVLGNLQRGFGVLLLLTAGYLALATLYEALRNR